MPLGPGELGLSKPCISLRISNSEGESVATSHRTLVGMAAGGTYAECQLN